MNKNTLTQHIYEAIAQVLGEGWYDHSPHPHFSRSETNRNLGTNPLYTDNGGHSNADRITQPSTVDYNGMNFHGQNYVISDNAFMIYKIKNFGHDRFTGSMNMFANTKDFRTNLDLLFGGARRGGRGVLFRSFTPQSKATTAKRNGYMSFTFWEFSLDGGQTWNIMRPRPLDKIQQSKMVVKSEQVPQQNMEPTDPANPSIETENINRNMSNKLRISKADLAFYVNESVKKIIHEIGDTPEGQKYLGRLQAKKQMQQGAETGENNGFGYYNKGTAGEIGQYADKQQKAGGNNQTALANAHAQGFNNQWSRVGNQPLHLKRSGR